MSAPSPTTPQQLGKYRIVGVLGEGAMGVVYRAHNPAIDREVAVKTIHKELLADRALTSTVVERFRREAVAAGRLSHPGIVAVYDYGDADDVAYIVIELAPGESLHDYVVRRGALSLDEIGALMAQLLDALGYAHERGVVHRDIKPSNLLVSATGRVKITDFGIARIASSEMTHSGVAVGTPSYMAPEQYAGAQVDHRANLFAAGVLLYELLTGTRPFRGETESKRSPTRSCTPPTSPLATTARPSPRASTRCSRPRSRSKLTRATRPPPTSPAGSPRPSRTRRPPRTPRWALRPRCRWARRRRASSRSSTPRRSGRSSSRSRISSAPSPARSSGGARRGRATSPTSSTRCPATRRRRPIAHG